MVSYTAIEAQVIFKMLLVLVTGQLAIAGQLGREVHVIRQKCRQTLVRLELRYRNSIIISLRREREGM